MDHGAVSWGFFNLSCSVVSSWVVFGKSHLISIENVICSPLPECVPLNNVSVEMVWYTAPVFRDKSPRANTSLCLKGFLCSVFKQN